MRQDWVRVLGRAAGSAVVRQAAPIRVAVVAASVFFPSCAPTQNYGTLRDGHIYQRIVCRASTPGKCTTRAREVCGEYAVVEPLHEVPDAGSDLTMTVECRSFGAALGIVDAGE